MEPRLNNKT